MSLYCEAFLPDMSLKESEFVRVLTNIAAKLTQQRHAQKAQGGPAVDLRFLLPAGADKPDFKGMRLPLFKGEGFRLLTAGHGFSVHRKNGEPVLCHGCDRDVTDRVVNVSGVVVNIRRKGLGKDHRG